MNLFIVDGPEPMEVKHLFVPLGHGFHLTIGLVTNAVVDGAQIGLGQNIIELLREVVCHVTREEGAFIVPALHEGVDGVSVCFYRGDNNFSMFVFQLLGLTHGRSYSIHCLGKDSSCVIHSERDILHAVTMLRMVQRELTLRKRVVWCLENVNNLIVSNDMRAPLAIACLQALEGDVVETHAGGVEGCCLGCIAHPESAVIKAVKVANFRAFSGFLVINHR